jgi:hypothetical protein
VYASDVKKIINWYNIVSVALPEAFVSDVTSEIETAE